MIQEQKILLGSMDKNNSPESLNIYDYLDAHNIRTVGNGESEANYVTNLEGTELITVNLPQGQNRCIGSKGFEQISKAYFIRYNSMGYHQIVEFDFESRFERTIFENLTDTDNEDILNWTANTYFTDIRVVHENFLILNNGVNPIYNIDLTILKSNRGSRTVQLDDLVLNKKPSLQTPRFEYHSDDRLTSNSLRGRLFQFRTQFEYEDSMTSAWSTISKRNVPETEPSDGNGQNVSSNNCIYLWVDIGDDRVETINISLREGNGNWLLLKEVSRDYILQLTSAPLYVGEPTDVPRGFVSENYNPVTNEYGFVFYNEGLYPILDPVEVALQYDHIPQKAETVEIINGNIVAIGGLTEGYDRPELESFTTDVTYYRPDLNSSVSEEDNPFTVDNINHYTSSDYRYWDMYFRGDPVAGDTIRISIIAIGQVTPVSFEYVVTNTDESNGRNYALNSFVNNVAPQMPLGLGEYLSFNTSSGGYVSLRTRRDGSQWSLNSIYIENQNIGSLSTKSINTLKNGASYQLAYAAYDKYGRFFPIVTDDRFIVTTNTLADESGLLPQINWSLPLEAPAGAVGYQILMSENRTYQKYVTVTGVVDSSADSGGDYIVFNLKSLDRFSRFEKDSQVNYDFTKGDKVTLIEEINGSGDHLRWVRYPFIELDIVSFDIEVPTDEGDVKYLLTVRNTPLLNNYSIDDDSVEFVMELYTPKTAPVGTEQELFYEIGVNHLIENGEHTVTFGTIVTGDSYFRGRLYRSSVTNQGISIDVADPNFSDNYESNFWSAGRARFYDDERGRVEKRGSIRYSDEYIYGSNYNGIGRFYTERIYGESGGQPTSKHGWIRKLESRDNALMCFQEFKVGVIPVYKTIIYDNTDTSLVADSGRIFGSIQYRVGNYGIGNAKESFSVSNDGLMYFLDDNHCVPLRDSLSGIDVIDRNMSKHFVTYVKEAKDRGAKFIGVYDNFHKEWNLTVEDVDGRLITVTFSDADVIYRDSFTPPLSAVTVIQPDNGTATLVGNQLTYTPNTDYVGTDTITLEYPSPDGTKQKFEVIEVLAGNNVPNTFTFTNLTNRERNRLVTSNQIVVTGINMPSPISVVGGEYQINGGSWVTSSGTVVEGETVRVRHTTSSDYDTEVTTTLTIGGVSGRFTSETVPMSTSPDPFTVTGYLSKVTDRIHVKLELSHTLSMNYTIYCKVRYNAYGSVQETPDIQLTVPNGSTEVEFTTDYFLGSTGTINQGALLLETSTLANGSIVVTADSVGRVVNIYQGMYEEV